MRKFLMLGAVAALSVAGQAMAQDAISYSYLEANYVTADIDGVSGNPDGFGINGSIGFTPMLHGFVDYTNLDYNGITVQGWEVGLGLNHSLTSMLDLVGRAAYLKADIEGPGSDDGLALQGGVRAHFTNNFEVDGLVHYTDLDDGGDNTSLRVNGRYFFMPQFAVGAGVEYDSDATLWNVGFRYTFAK